MKVYDAETDKFVFVPNLIVLQNENGEEMLFETEDCLDAFCRFLFIDEDSLSNYPRPQSLYAHNASGFDSMFILQKFVNTMTDDPSICFDGKSPLRIKFKKLEIKDTYRFFQCALSRLPKTFGITCMKGHFPHDFNIPANQNYEGNIPPLESYGVKYFQEKDYLEFKKWWEKEDADIRKGVKPPWNFKSEILAYCRDDVKILRLCWLAFEKNMYEVTGLYPGVGNLSVASFTNLVWKSTIKPFEIGVVPANNYVHNDQQSTIAKEWLLSLDTFYYGGEMVYSGKNGEGEKRIQLEKFRRKVDGYHEPSKTVLEFAGCHFHGCNVCTKPDERSPHLNKRFRDVRTEFSNRICKLKSNGYSVEVKWECEWKAERETDDIKTMLDEIRDLLPNSEDKPINPRHALFGGRTEASGVYFVSPSEKEYVAGVDFTSLYPSVMKNGDFPTHHPRVIWGPKDRFDYKPDAYFGLMKCKLYPPKRLFHPVLPYRVITADGNVKLVFTLCSTCAAQSNRAQCTHTDEERALKGTWVTLEVYKAMKMGYKLVEIKCVWDYAVREKGLFSKFVDKFYKLKTEASGYPSACDTDQKKREYIKEFQRVEGIKLDPEKIKYDGVLRFVMKLLLNSCWG